MKPPASHLSDKRACHKFNLQPLGQIPHAMTPQHHRREHRHEHFGGEANPPRWRASPVPSASPELASPPMAQPPAAAGVEPLALLVQHDATFVMAQRYVSSGAIPNSSRRNRVASESVRQASRYSEA